MNTPATSKRTSIGNVTKPKNPKRQKKNSNVKTSDRGTNTNNHHSTLPTTKEEMESLIAWATLNLRQGNDVSEMEKAELTLMLLAQPTLFYPDDFRSWSALRLELMKSDWHCRVQHLLKQFKYSNVPLTVRLTVTHNFKLTHNYLKQPDDVFSQPFDLKVVCDIQSKIQNYPKKYYVDQ